MPALFLVIVMLVGNLFNGYLMSRFEGHIAISGSSRRSVLVTDAAIERPFNSLHYVVFNLIGT